MRSTADSGGWDGGDGAASMKTSRASQPETLRSVVTTRVTRYTPGTVNACVARAPENVEPSPKVQSNVTIVPSAADEALPSNSMGSPGWNGADVRMTMLGTGGGDVTVKFHVTDFDPPGHAISAAT